MSNSLTIWQSIAIGGAGGFVAGITVYLAKKIVNYFNNKCDSNKIYSWLKKNSQNNNGRGWESTRNIASFNNLTQDRVRFLCSISRKIRSIPNSENEIWTIYPSQSDKYIDSDKVTAG